MIAAWLRAAARANATAIVACPAGDRDRIPAKQYVDQIGITFGERLANSVDSVFSLGYESVIVTGIDVAPPQYLNSVFSRIEAGRSVIAPARDGGINLLGLSSPRRELLLTFTIRDPRVADRCRDFLDDVEELPAASDIDTIHDLLRFEDRPRPVVGRLKPALTLFLAAAGDTRAPPAG